MPAEAYYSLESGYHAANLEVTQAGFRLIAAERWRKIGPLVGSRRSIFEFGAGTGLNLANATVARRAGCDIGAHLAHPLRELGIEFFGNPGEAADGEFDLALAHHSLEHVTSPHDTLRELWRILRPDGRLVLFVPFEKERRYRRFDPNEPNHHLYSWNAQTLANLVVACGFSVESSRCRATGYERFAARIGTRLGLKHQGYRTLLAVLRLLHTPEEIEIVARKEVSP